MFRKNRPAILLTALLITCCTYFIVFALNLDAEAHKNSPSENHTDTMAITTGWQYHWGDSPTDSNGHRIWLDTANTGSGWSSYQFPGRPGNTGNNNFIWIKAVLPQGSYQHPTLRFRAPQQAVEVYVGEKEIYSYGRIDPNEKIRTPGSIWHIADLPGDFSGKAVTFRLYSPFPHYSGFLLETEVGERSSHIVNIVRETGMDFVFGCLFILIGLALFLLELSGSNEWDFLIYLGLGFICMGGWYISESKLLQLFTYAPVSMTYFANFFIFLTPIWILIFVDKAFNHQSKSSHLLLRIMYTAHAILAVSAFALDMTGILSSLYFDKVLHIMLPVSMLLIVYTVVSETKGGFKNSMLFIAGVLALGITGLIDTFVLFYSTSQMLKLFKTSYIGMLIFIFTLLVIVSRKLKVVYNNLKTNSIEIETNYKSLFTNMTDGFTYNRIETNADGGITKCIILESNQAFLELTGMESASVIGADMYSFIPEISELNMHLCKTAGESAPSVNISPESNPVRLGGKWYKLSAFCPRKEYLSIIFSDITVIKNAEETIRHQAYTDGMTGFNNRTCFEETMLSLHGILKDIKPLSIVAIDIDGLKITNDTFGHNAGDDLLKQSASIISSVFGSCGIISRVGGDEFCIILKNTDYTVAQDKADELVKATEAINKLNPIVPVSMSIGVATSGISDTEDIYELYKRADDNMYRYKLSQATSDRSKAIDMLLSALSEKDYVSQGHVERLLKLCDMMGDALGLHDVQRRNLVLLSKMHDLGKIGIPDEILNKAGKLSGEEYDKMKQHVKIGYNIASRSKELVTIAPLILHHHEYWNGKGYPDSLKGTEIPLECRILGILDAYDAMTNDRPYHKGISSEEAMNEIRKCSGSQFDPVLSGKFIEILSKELAYSS